MAMVEDKSDAPKILCDFVVYSASNTFLSGSVNIFRYSIPRVDRGNRQKC
jgi:hypothetical protein